MSGPVGFWNRLTASERRTITTSAMILAPFVLFFGIVKPYRASINELHDRAAAERALLAGEERVIQLGPSLPQMAKDASERAQRANMRLVSGANRALEEAELTSYLERTAQLSRVLLQESRGTEPPRGTDTTGAVRPLRLAVKGESDLKGVLTYIQRIEASPLLLHIAELSMEPVTEKTSQETQDGVIKFALVLDAYTSGSTGQSLTSGRGVKQ